MSVYEKLAVVQQKLKAPKGQYNTFGKYKYRSCEDILKAVKPLLASTKTVLTLSDAVEYLGDRFYIVASAVFTDLESGEAITTVGMAREETEKKGMDGSQITGTASSYARKYALNGLFCIDDNKDSDSTNEESAQNGGMQPPGPLCEHCGEEIMPYNDGKSKWTAKQVADNAKKKYGKCLCVKCSKKEAIRIADEQTKQFSYEYNNG